jgi:tetratricopeptide (TPR) repeat protein
MRRIRYSLDRFSMPGVKCLFKKTIEDFDSIRSGRYFDKRYKLLSARLRQRARHAKAASMQEYTKKVFLYMLIGLVLLINGFSNPAAALETPLILTVESAFPAAATDSLSITRKLALFEARKQAVASAASELMRKGLLKHYGEQEPEIFCLVAEKIRTRILSAAYVEEEKRYVCRIRAEVSVIDFMEAEIENQELEKKESAFPWKEEMEQPVLPSIAPGRELSRAYRYLRQDQIRIAIIYLDHLAAKYPGWGEVYYLRGLGFQRMHSSEQMQSDFEKACSLNHQEACKRLEVLK